MKTTKNQNIKEKNITYDDLINLDDYDLILIDNSFLKYVIGYHKLIRKYTNDIDLIIKNISVNTEISLDHSIIIVKDLKELLFNMPTNSWEKTNLKKLCYNDKLTSSEAYNLLTNDISSSEELFEDENKWIRHSIFVGIAASRIATKLNLDSNYAKSLGYIHDIGRKIDHNNHVLEGYKYMINSGFKDEAKICLTHSFINNDINLTAGGGPKNVEVYERINNFLNKNEPTIYDNIIQLCDLFCTEKGFTTIEKRLLDISKRKGIYDNSKEHFEKALELKEKIETLMGCNLYSLFPDISVDELNNIEIDRIELKNLLNNNVKKYIVK